MKKYFFVVLLSICIFNLVAEENIYKKFVDINNSLTTKTFLVNQKLETYNISEHTKKVKTAKSIFCNNKEFTVLLDDKNLSILSTPAGYWMKNSKTRTPIKISGSFSVDEIQMQDLLKIDYENDYSIESQTNNSYLLKRKNKKNTYSWLELSYDEKNGLYTILAMDKNKQAIKKIQYKADFIDNIECFSTIKISNLVLNVNIESCFTTESIKPIKISKALFSSEYMDELLKCIE